MKGRVFTILALFSLGATAARASFTNIPKKHEHRVPKAADRPACKATVSEDRNRYRCDCAKAGLRFEVEKEKAAGTLSDLKSGKPIASFKFDENAYMLIDYGSAQLDLNGDGVADAVISIGLGGNGLAAESSYKIFAVSKKMGWDLYRAVDFTYLKEGAFVVGTGPGLLYRHVDYAQYGPCLDKKDHAFWVSQAVQFVPPVGINNEADPIFPHFVFFGYKANRKETSLLDERMKAELLKNRRDPQWYIFESAEAP